MSRRNYTIRLTRPELVLAAAAIEERVRVMDVRMAHVYNSLSDALSTVLNTTAKRGSVMYPYCDGPDRRQKQPKESGK